MKANELRIGNKLKCYGIIVNVEKINPPYVQDSTEVGGQFDLKDCEPIPLTPEILEKCGFISHERYSELIIVDVREYEDEFCGLGGHIPCAVNYPWRSGVLEQRYSELPKTADILVV